MQFRTLGKTGWEVSAIGFGAWGIGGQWGPVSEADAREALNAAFDAGMNFFDTADAYGVPPGLSEEIMGRTLQSRRNQILIATKVGNFARRMGHPLSFASPLHVHLCCDASLGRLKTDVIDLYQCHIGGIEDPSIYLHAFEELRQAGKIRAYGISTDDEDVLRTFNRDDACSAVQLDYSFLNRRPEKKLLPYCEQENIGVIVRGPLHKGLCAGKFNAETAFTDSVRERWNEGEGREPFRKKIETVETLRCLENADRTLAQAALQFVLAHPAVSMAIPGAKSRSQALANGAAADGELTAAELAKARERTQAP